MLEREKGRTLVQGKYGLHSAWCKYQVITWGCGTSFYAKMVDNCCLLNIFCIYLESERVRVSWEFLSMLLEIYFWLYLYRDSSVYLSNLPSPTYLPTYSTYSSFQFSDRNLQDKADLLQSFFWDSLIEALLNYYFWLKKDKEDWRLMG